MLRYLLIAALCWGAGLSQVASGGEVRAGDATTSATRNAPLRPATSWQQPSAAVPSRWDAPSSSDRSVPIEPATAARSEAPAQQPVEEIPTPSDVVDSSDQDAGPFSQCCGPNNDCSDWDECDICRLWHAIGRAPLEVHGEYLMWWVSGNPTPPLVTTSTAGTDRTQAGVLGQPNTTILFGNDEINIDQRSGARVDLKWWFDTDHAIEGEWFGLAEQEDDFHQSSDGSTILARPFFNISTHAADAFVIAFPAQLSGNVDVKSSSRLMGAGIGLSENLFRSGQGCNDDLRLDFLYGFRFLRLAEDLIVSDQLTVIDPAGVIPIGTQFATYDQFSTVDHFYGLNVGLSAEQKYNRWVASGLARVALGVTHEQVTIIGNSSTSTPEGDTTNFNGGLLAMPTNIGTFTRSKLGFVPQAELKLAYLVTQHLQLSLGYDVMYWSFATRPGQQIDTMVNPSQASGETLTGEPAPLRQSKESGVWIQGLSFGAEWRF